MADFRWYGDKAMAAITGAAAQSMGICAADLQGKSATQAPIDTGDLRANCSVSPVEQTRDTIQVRVGYNLVYAAVQHERLDFRHPKGGKAKFLEDPYKENFGKYISAIGAAIRRAVGR